MGEYDLSYYHTEAGRLALEIQRKLVILGIDWNSDAAMRELAARIMNAGSGSDATGDHSAITWFELRGLISLMNIVMAESAEKNVEIHGNECWKAIAKALWAAKGEVGR